MQLIVNFINLFQRLQLHLISVLHKYKGNTMEQTDIFNQPLIAFDNSILSLQMLTIFQRMKYKFDKSIVLHVYNSQKNYIPMQMKGLQIQQFLKQKYPKENENIRVMVKDKVEKSINEIILETFLTNRCNLLFLGFVGFKGFKPRNNDLSSRVRQFVYESKVDVAIIKKQPLQRGRIVYCCDGSEISLDGIKYAVDFCSKFGLQMEVLHATNPDLKQYSKHIRKTLKDLQAKYRNVQYNCKFIDGAIIDFLKDKAQAYEWIFLTKNGYRGQITKKRYVGSVTTLILEQINCNLIILN